MQTAMVQTPIAMPAKAVTARRTAAPVSCTLRQDAARVAKAAGVSIATLGLALSAHAANVKLGTDTGSLVFDPDTVTIKAGESVTWTNNAGFPHNVVFDEDAIPGGESADKLSHEDYLNAKGETVSTTFKTAGTYEYYCEPHQGAGMAGKVIVQ
jgi:plastocyanin